MKTLKIIIVLVFIGVLFTFSGNYQKETGNNSQPPFDTITDIDGNVYHTLTIGSANASQVWMVENLKVTHYRNGDPIPKVTDGKVWNNLTTGAYCDYENKTSNNDLYGRLYNWFAVVDTRNVCPTGWHIPSNDEWFSLTYNLGESVAGSKLKEAGTAHWRSPNTDATNETGFTFLPGGYRGDNALFEEKGFCGYLWSSTELNSENVYIRKMLNHESAVKTCCDYKKYGLSVRCIKD